MKKRTAWVFTVNVLCFSIFLSMSTPVMAFTVTQELGFDAIGITHQVPDPLNTEGTVNEQVYIDDVWIYGMGSVDYPSYIATLPQSMIDVGWTKHRVNQWLSKFSGPGLTQFDINLSWPGNHYGWNIAFFDHQEVVAGFVAIWQEGNFTVENPGYWIVLQSQQYMYTDAWNFQPDGLAVPEPSTFILFAVGVGGLAFIRRNKYPI